MGAMLTWLGGGAGAIVVVNAVAAWLVAAGAVSASTDLPAVAVLGLCLVFGLLVGAVTRTVAAGVPTSRSALAGRVAVGIAVGAVVGELTSILLFSGAIDRRIDTQASQGPTAAPAVVAATADLDRARDARASLDVAVEQARTRRDEALVVARCEYNPSPGCPQTHITGVPGTGPETRTANGLLAGAQQELDTALTARDGRAAALDASVEDAQQQLGQARTAAVAGADRGLGARWMAMNAYTFSEPGALLLRLAAIAFFALLTLLPLILRLWRGETDRERADLEADTAIAVKRAEVRANAETLWAEQQLANARFAVAAQNEIDREYHRRRVLDAVGVAAQPATLEFVEDDVHLPIAAEAEAASRAVAELPAGTAARGGNAPVPVTAVDQRGSLIPTIPEVTKAAARWIRPLVPPIVTRVIDTTTQPLRAARQAFEEVEEITFSFKRVRKVTLHSEESAAAQPQAPAVPPPGGLPRVEASFERPAGQGMPTGWSAALDAAGNDAAGPMLTGRGRGLDRGPGSRELGRPTGPRELPPAE